MKDICVEMSRRVNLERTRQRQTYANDACAIYGPVACDVPVVYKRKQDMFCRPKLPLAFGQIFSLVSFLSRLVQM